MSIILAFVLVAFVGWRVGLSAREVVARAITSNHRLRRGELAKEAGRADHRVRLKKPSTMKTTIIYTPLPVRYTEQHCL
jgi:hypothetical protein